MASSLSNALKAFSIVQKYLPLILQLVAVAEEVHGPGTGPQKRETVLNGVKALIVVFVPGFTVDAELEKLIGAVIDYIVFRMNASGELPTPTPKG